MRPEIWPSPFSSGPTRNIVPGSMFTGGDDFYTLVVGDGIDPQAATVKFLT
jgi:hypothetical protein